MDASLNDAVTGIIQDHVDYIKKLKTLHPILTNSATINSFKKFINFFISEHQLPKRSFLNQIPILKASADKIKKDICEVISDFEVAIRDLLIQDFLDSSYQSWDDEPVIQQEELAFTNLKITEANEKESIQRSLLDCEQDFEYVQLQQRYRAELKSLDDAHFAQQVSERRQWAKIHIVDPAESLVIPKTDSTTPMYIAKRTRSPIQQQKVTLFNNGNILTSFFLNPEGKPLLNPEFAIHNFGRLNNYYICAAFSDHSTISETTKRFILANADKKILGGQAQGKTGFKIIRSPAGTEQQLFALVQQKDGSRLIFAPLKITEHCIILVFAALLPHEQYDKLYQHANCFERVYHALTEYSFQIEREQITSSDEDSPSSSGCRI